MNSEIVLRKILFVVVVYGLLNTGVFLWLKPEVFRDRFYSLYLVMYYTSGLLDTLIRPLDLEKKEEGGFVKYIGLLFILSPFLFVLAITEQENLYTRNNLLSLVGLLIYFLSTALVLLVRYQLGKQATGTLVIVDNHELITSGPYRIVRHPLYSAALFGLLGFTLLTQGYIVGIFTYALYFIIFRERAIYEESLLLQEFGDNYLKYKQSISRFIPFIY